MLAAMQELKDDLVSENANQLSVEMSVRGQNYLSQSRPNFDVVQDNQNEEQLTDEGDPHADEHLDID